MTTASRTPRRRPTLKDVGLKANVDASIASRVLSGEMKHASEETRARIFAAASELGWRAHPAAKSLRTGSSTTLALIVPNLHNPAYGSMIRGAQRAAALADHVMVFADMEGTDTKELDELRRISGHVDGIIIASAQSSVLGSTDLLSTLVPTVLLNRRGVPGVPAVIGPDEQGAILAAEHLLALGHRRIGILTAPRTLDTATRRGDAFAARLRESGVHLMFEVEAPLDVDAAASAISPFLERPAGERPTAIFGAALTAALGVMVGARSAGLTIPTDLSLIGLDDAQVAELVTPGLTTILMPHESMGVRAVESLLRLIAGEELPISISVDEPAELVLRGTTGPNREKEQP